MACAQTVNRKYARHLGVLIVSQCVIVSKMLQIDDDPRTVVRLTTIVDRYYQLSFFMTAGNGPALVRCHIVHAVLYPSMSWRFMSSYLTVAGDRSVLVTT